MTGIARSTSAESFGLVMIMSVAAPRNRKTLRSAIEMLTPKAALTWVVSAVRRETISPLRVWSKKAGSSEVRCRNRSEEHTSELQSRQYLVCRLLLEKKKKQYREEES